MTRRDARHGESEPLAKVFGKRLCQAMEERKIKTKPLARATGIGLRVVQKHRAGEHIPTQENLFRYSRVLNKPRDWFFREEESEAA